MKHADVTAEAVPQEQEKRLVDVLKRFKAVREREAKVRAFDCVTDS
jgi:hypothetical protein